MRTRRSSFLLLAVAVIALPAHAHVVRSELLVESEPGVEIFVREVRRSPAADAETPPILLLHGARVPGVASFDLAVSGGSLAADLALAGHAVYVMDARGYGRSTGPPEMSRPPGDSPPLVRSPAVVRDVAAVVEWICSRREVERVALLGWATGGHWLGYYSTLHPERVSHLILYNTLYGGSSEHPDIGHGSSVEDPERPGRFHTQAFGGYRLNTEESLFPAWDRSIPVEDKAEWRDPAVAKAYAEAALASDPTSDERTPPSFRAPSGALEDSFYLAIGRQLWDASLILAPTLILASELDFWSRQADHAALEAHLTHAPTIRRVELPQATHFVHLDRAERGRDVFLREVLAFLGPHEAH